MGKTKCGGFTEFSRRWLSTLPEPRWKGFKCGLKPRKQSRGKICAKWQAATWWCEMKTSNTSVCADAGICQTFIWNHEARSSHGFCTKNFTGPYKGCCCRITAHLACFYKSHTKKKQSKWEQLKSIWKQQSLGLSSRVPQPLEAFLWCFVVNKDKSWMKAGCFNPSRVFRSWFTLLQWGIQHK